MAGSRKNESGDRGVEEIGGGDPPARPPWICSASSKEAGDVVVVRACCVDHLPEERRG
jgi:hypothetical protein